MVDEEEVEKSFCLSKPDGWVINRKMKKIILLEFKRTTDSSESYYKDMWKVSDQQDNPILTGLRVLAADRERKVEVIPLVVGQRSVNDKEWLESLKVFGIGKEDDNKIIQRLSHTLLNEHEKLFDSYWWYIFASPGGLL